MQKIIRHVKLFDLFLYFVRTNQSNMINVNNSNVIKHVLNFFFLVKAFILNFCHELNPSE